MQPEKQEDGSYNLGDKTLTADEFKAFRGAARKDIWTDLSKEFDTKFDGVITGLKENASVLDKVAALSGEFSNLKTTIEDLKKKPEGDKKNDKSMTELEVEQFKAEMKKDFEKEMAGTKEDLFQDAIMNKLEAKLIAKGWKDERVNLIPSIINTEFKIDNDNGNPVFRDLNDEGTVMAGGLTERAEELIKKYSDMTSRPKAGWNDTSSTTVIPDERLKTMSNRDLMEAEVGEMLNK